MCRGCDPLQCAAEGGHAGIFELLLTHDCNPMGADHLNATLLHYAASGGNLEIMQKLLDLGCNKDALTKYGRSVLHYSAYGMATHHAQPSLMTKFWYTWILLVECSKGRCDMATCQAQPIDFVIHLYCFSRCLLEPSPCIALIKAAFMSGFTDSRAVFLNLS